MKTPTTPIVQPDKDGRFPTPADGAIWMLVTHGIPQTVLCGAEWQHVHEQKRGKAPFLSGWQKPENLLTTVEAIRAAAEKFPGCNFGSVFNKDRFAFEADAPPEGVPSVRERFEATGNSFTSPLMILSSVVNSVPRGHRYYLWVPSIENVAQSTEATKYGDYSIRASGEQCVSPGSIHPKTRDQYRVKGTGTLAQPSKEEIAFWESERVKAPASAPRKGSEEVRLYYEGGRNSALASRAAYLRQGGANEAEMLETLSRLNQEQCVPSLPEDEVQNIAKSFGKYPPGQDHSLLLTQWKANKQDPGSAAQVQITPELLEQEFPAYDGSQPPEVPMLIKGFMPKGTSFLGSLSGIGKTWFALAVAKALTTGEPLWGVFEVPEKVAVLYLIPEASKQSFCYRLSKMGIVRDKTLFRYRTISEGVTQPLNGQLVYAMVKELATQRDVLIVVDTAVRFLRAGDENSSMENTLIQDTELLGSITKETGTTVSFLFQHHSPKASKDAAELTLENVLRGTGDFGAMADCVYGLRRDEGLYAGGEGPEEMEVVCVKPRNVHPAPLPFRLALSRRPAKDEVVDDDRPTVSYIDTTGNLHYIGNAGVKDAVIAKAVAMVKENPDIGFNTLVKETKMNRGVLKELLASRGYTQKPHFVNGKKKFRWSNSILTMSAPGVQEPRPNTVSLGGSNRTRSRSLKPCHGGDLFQGTWTGHRGA